MGLVVAILDFRGLAFLNLLDFALHVSTATMLTVDTLKGKKEGKHKEVNIKRIS